MLAVLFLCLLKCDTEMHVLTQGGARCAEMDAAPHIFMRRADSSDAYASALSPAAHDSACGRMGLMNYLKF